MKTLEAEGLCIKSIDYGDADKLVTVYLRGKGKLLCRARGVRKPNAKLKQAVAPFNYGNYTLFDSNGYYTLRTCETVNSHLNIVRNIERYYLSLFMLELLDRFSREGDDTDELLDCVLDFLDSITLNPSLGVCNAYLFQFIERAGFGMPINSMIFNKPIVKISALQAAQGLTAQDDEVNLFLFMSDYIEKNGEIKLKTVSEITALYTDSRG